MNKKYTVICRDKKTRKVHPEVCDGESEFNAAYKFKHEHEECDILQIKESNVTPSVFPNFRTVALFVTGLCAISLVLFPVIILIVHCLHELWLTFAS